MSTFLRAFVWTLAFTALAAGQVTFGGSGTQQTSRAQKDPSVVGVTLGQIGDQDVSLGSSLMLQLSVASITYKAPVSFSASPLPLPANASLNGVTGLFTFTPDPTQVGTHTLKFSASTWMAHDSETIVITVIGAPPGGITEVTGTLLDTTDFLAGTTTPVVNATVSLLDEPTVLPAITRGDGTFVLTSIVGTSHVLDVDVTNADPAPDGSPYAGFRESVDLIEGVTNTLPQPIFLPRIDVDSLTTVNPASTTVVTNPNIDVSLSIPAGTAFDDMGLFSGELSISEVPQALAPAPLPEDLNPGLLITIQPVGVTFDPPAPITFPNTTDDLPPNTIVDIWSLDPDLGTFVVVGKAQVSGDGTKIATIQGGILAADWHMVLPPKTAIAEQSKDSTRDDPCADTYVSGSSSTSVSTGNLQEVHALAAYRSGGKAHALRLVYNSLLADPQPVMAADATIPVIAAVPNAVSTTIDVGGIDQGVEVYTSTVGLSESVDETIRTAIQFDASPFATGRYPYTLRQSSHYAASSVTSSTPGHVVVNNQKGSPFGAGWTLDGLSSLIVDDNENALIVGGHGDATFFELATVGPGSKAYWTFDDGVSPTADVVGNHDGQVVGASFVTDATLPTGDNVYSLSFDGTDDYVNVPDAPNLNPAAGVTVSAWVKRDAIIGVGDPVLTKAGEGTSQINGYTLEFDLLGGPIEFWVYVAGAWRSSASAPVPLDEWTHLAGSYDGSEILIYVDGVPFGTPTSITGTITPSGNDLRIGGNESNPGRHYSGLIDEARVFNVALPPDQIALLASGQTGLGAVNGLLLKSYADAGGGFPAMYSAVANGFLGMTASPFTLTSGGGVPAIVTEAVVPVVDFPVTPFDALGFYGVGPDGIVNGGSTFLSPKGDDVSIQPPTDVFGVSLSGYVFVPTGGNVSFTVGVDDVFDLIVNGQSIISKTSGGPYNEMTGVATGLPQGFNPITLNFADGDQDANLVLKASGGGLPGGIVPPGYLFAEIPDSFEQYQAPAGDSSTLTRATDGSFNRTLPNGIQIHYDAAGFQTSVIDRNGNTTSYGYDSGLLTSITDPADLTTTLAYQSGRLTTITDPANRTTSFEHDGAGNLRAIVDPDTTRREFIYDARHRLVSQLSKRNFETRYEYSFAGRHERSILADGSTLVIEPSELVPLADTVAGEGSLSNPAPVVRPEQIEGRSTNGRGYTTIYHMDKFGGATSVQDALGRTTTFDRDFDGRTIRITRPNGAVVSMTYDAQGSLLSRTEEGNDGPGDPAGDNQVAAFSYGAFGLVTSMTDPKQNINPSTGVTVSLEYDSVGNLLRVIDAEDVVTEITYDEPGFGHPGLAGLPTRMTEGMGLPEESTTRLKYDSLKGNVEEITDGEDRITRFVRTAVGSVDMVIVEGNDSNPSSDQVTQFEYDGLERVTAVIDAELNKTMFGRDDSGNVTSVTDAKPLSGVTTYAYDSLDRLVAIADPFLRETTFSHDANGNVDVRIDRNGQEFTFTYDEVDRLIKEEYPGSGGAPTNTVVNFGWDANANADLTDDNDNIALVVTVDTSLAMSYDAFDRLTEVSTAGGTIQPASAISYAYDLNGNRISLDAEDEVTGTSLSSLMYEFDARDNMIVVDNLLAGQATSLSYDSLETLSAIGWSNNTGSSFAYDSSSLLVDVHHVLDPLGARSTLSRFSYSYDSVGNRESIIEDRVAFGLTGIITLLGYDDTNQLTSSDYSDLSDEAFDYDEVGNVFPTLWQYDVGNRLLRDGEFAYAYDLEGNVVSRVELVSPSEITSYAYDEKNRLKQVTNSDGTTASYDYDGLGRRIRKTVTPPVGNSVSTTYIYDFEDILLEFEAIGGGPLGLRARYVHGSGIDQPLTMERDIDSSGEFGANEFYVYHVDGLGSVTEVSNASGSLVSAYRYNAFGPITAEVGSLVNPYGFTSRESDTESGLLHYRARQYNPAIGRFLQEDPLGFSGGGFNDYAYADNNPVNKVDPMGEDAYLFTQALTSNSPLPGHVLVAVDDPDNVGGIVVFDFFPAEGFPSGLATPAKGYVREQKLRADELLRHRTFILASKRQSLIEDTDAIRFARELRGAASSGDLKYQALFTLSELNCVGFANAVFQGSQ